MKILITAGGTSEKIDQVRRIANTGTGRLGSLTAEEFVRQGGTKIEKIYYVCEPGSIVPELDCVEVIPTHDVDEVGDALEKLLTQEKIDAVIHSMAVSDYAVESVTTAENLAAFLADRLFPFGPEKFESKGSLAEFLAACVRENDRVLDRSRKVGSNVGNLMLCMRRTPKLIGLVKALQPSTVLVGFKLLNGVEKQELLDAGYGVLEKNSCDLVLANDLTEISRGRHAGYLLSPGRTWERFESKEEIAKGIAGKVLSLIDREGRR
ncbi:phosphopantothenate--cysteine ligase [Caproiciproducens sp. NJN-50]|uniref:phosphopantothenoylcysteine decarboxylase domain-containing protein n=1 Tax=Acutalibacteraceae TaxID=3082771 RepID=UPI000FFE162D|nr:MULTISPECIES: phosphopantothenoylcysteine decarboxylase [Acutalibacteraceae]QAT51094.1 phosphopantothenate--cysteine ligase [Caproiciproducens sp. NJN-50]